MRMFEFLHNKKICQVIFKAGFLLASLGSASSLKTKHEKGLEGKEPMIRFLRHKMIRSSVKFTTVQLWSASV